MSTIESIAYRFRKVSYSIILAGVGFLLMTASFLTPAANAVTLDLQARDCDSNAVINCGAASTEELLQKYNEKADVRALFNHFGISRQEMRQMGTTAVAGIVTRDGNVTVDGKVVATDAMTAGRQNMSGSTAVSAGGTQFYMRPPSTSFQTQRLKAFVVMTDANANANNTGGASVPGNDNTNTNTGKRFAFAIIASCGNPVKATPKQPKPTPTTTKPEKPKEAQPKTLQPEKRPEIQKVPAQEQQQTQSQQQTATATANANATANVTVTQPEQQKPQPETKTVVERVEVPVPVTVVQQPVQSAPAPVEELPKTGMESVSSTLGIAGLATLLGAVAHLIYTRRKLS